MKQNLLRTLSLTVMIAAALAFCGCVYDSPITPKPTAAVNPAFLGNWTSQDGRVKMKVSKYDADNYVLIYDGGLYRAWESDVEGTPFFSVQNLDATQDGAYKFSYTTWTVAADGTLHGKAVSDKLVPAETKGSDAVQKLLKADIKNPDLLGDEIVFTKDK